MASENPEHSFPSPETVARAWHGTIMSLYDRSFDAAKAERGSWAGEALRRAAPHLLAAADAIDEALYNYVDAWAQETGR